MCHRMASSSRTSFASPDRSTSRTLPESSATPLCLSLCTCRLTYQDENATMLSYMPCRSPIRLPRISCLPSPEFRTGPPLKAPPAQYPPSSSSFSYLRTWGPLRLTPFYPRVNFRMSHRRDASTLHPCHFSVHHHCCPQPQFSSPFCLYLCPQRAWRASRHGRTFLKASHMSIQLVRSSLPILEQLRSCLALAALSLPRLWE